MRIPIECESHLYGGRGTVHDDHHLDIETYKGEILAVWFRCALASFEQTEVDARRAKELRSAGANKGTPLYGILFKDNEE